MAQRMARGTGGPSPLPLRISGNHEPRVRFPLTGLRGKLNFPTQFFMPYAETPHPPPLRSRIMTGYSFTSEHEFLGSSNRGRHDVWEARDPYEDEVEDFDEEEIEEDEEEDDDLDDDDDDDDDEDEEEEVEDYDEEDEVEN